MEGAVFISGKVVRGFGRGSRDLNCPTANLDCDLDLLQGLGTGIFYGFAFFPNGTPVSSPEEEKGDQVLIMCCSIGFNPQYGNDLKTLEVHILNDFTRDFYDEELKVVICGKIRDETKFSSLDALIKQIDSDKEISREKLSQNTKWDQLKQQLTQPWTRP